MNTQEFLKRAWEKAKAVEMSSDFFCDCLLKESSGDLLSKIILEGLDSPTKEDGGAYIDFRRIRGREFLDRLNPLARNKFIEMIRETKDYQSLLRIAEEDLKERRDIAIEASQHYAEEGFNSTMNRRKGLLSIHFAKISNKNRLLRKTIKRELKIAQEGGYVGDYRCFYNDLEQNPLPLTETETGRKIFGEFPMEDLADYISDLGFHREATKVRREILLRLASEKERAWDERSPLKEIDIGLDDLFRKRVHPENNRYTKLGYSQTLGLFLRTSKVLGYEEKLHPFAIDSCIGYLAGDAPSCRLSIGNLFGIWEVAHTQGTILTEEQEEKLRKNVLGSFFRDLGNRNERKKAICRYGEVKDLFVRDPETLDSIELAMYEYTPLEERSQILDRVQTEKARLQVVKKLLHGEENKLPLPEEAARYLSSRIYGKLHPKEQKGINGLIRAYEGRFRDWDKGLQLMYLLGMEERLCEYEGIKNMFKTER